MNKLQWLVVVIFAISYAETTEIIRDSYDNYLMLKLLILLPLLEIVSRVLGELED